MKQCAPRDIKASSGRHLFLATAVAACSLSLAGADLLPRSSIMRRLPTPLCKDDSDCQLGEKCRGDESGQKACQKPNCAERGGICGGIAGGLRAGQCRKGEVEVYFEDRCDSGCGYFWGQCGQPCCATEEAARSPESIAANGTSDAVLAGGMESKAAVPAVPRPQHGNGAPDEILPGTRQSIIELLCLGLVASVSLLLYRRMGGVQAGGQDGADETWFVE